MIPKGLKSSSPVKNFMELETMSELDEHAELAVLC